ncbi:MAG: LolA-related protein [Caldimonas sp.]
MPQRPPPPRPDRRAAAGVLAAGLLLGPAWPAARAAAVSFGLAELTTLLARRTSGEARFTESRSVRLLDQTLVSNGRLSYRAPDTFVRETLKPWPERLAVTGNVLTLTRGERSRTMQLDASPEAAVIVEAIRGTLSGNRASLERLFEATVSGDAGHWTLDLVPRDLRLRGQVASVRVSGSGSAVAQVQVQLADGDRSVMTIEPAGSAPR